MRMSEVLSRLASEPGERLTIRSIFAILSDRSMFLMVVLLGLPNCIPMPPPIPTLSGLLLVFVALQIGFGRTSLWMPDVVLRRSIEKIHVTRAVSRALPWVLKMENFSRERLLLFTPRISALLTALLLVILALGMLTAAPFLGQIPFGLGICLIGLGLVERDGALIVGGTLLGLVGLFVSASFAFAIIVALREWF
jgi:hypothetical protein